MSTAVRRRPLLIALLALLGASLLPTGPVRAQVQTLHISWYRFPLADQLQLLANTYSQEHLGVRVVVDEVPLTQWYSSDFAQFSSHHTGFAAMIMPSQWLGEAVTRGYVRELTPWLQQNVNISDFAPYLFAAYSQYPQRLPGETGSLNLKHGHFYGVPWQGDALGFAYRKDLFADPTNQRAFQTRYHYRLGVPQSMDQLTDIADFFTVPTKGRYGIALYEQSSATAAAATFNAWCWNYGGDLWNAATGQVQGILNSPRCVHALSLVDHLTQRDSPPSMGDGSIAEALRAMGQGQVAIMEGWWGSMAGLFDTTTSTLGRSQVEIARKIGFFNFPGERYQGVSARWSPLGGAGLAISAYASPRDQAAALDFARWFLTPSVQTLWYQAGGASVSRSVLASPGFLSAEPWYPLQSESYTRAKDFWNIPEFQRMVATLATTIHSSMVGQIAAGPALDAIAKAQAQILRATGAYPFYRGSSG